MKEKDFRKDCLLTDSPVLARQTAARGLPVIYYERPGAEPVYEADYTVQSLDDLDEFFFQRVYERHYGLPWSIGETERLKIRESTEEDVEKLRQFVEKMQDLAKTLRKKPEATFGVRFAEADAAFHRALYTKLDLPLLLSLIDAFWAFDKNYQKPTSGSYIQLTVEKHERIVSALEKKDYHAFYDALDFHYRVVYRPGDESEQAFEEEN